MCSNRNFRHSKITSAKFINANLSGTDFTGSNLRGTDFTGANLTNVTFYRVYGQEPIIIKGATVENTIFIELIMSSLDFSDTKVHASIKEKSYMIQILKLEVI